MNLAALWVQLSTRSGMLKSEIVRSYIQFHPIERKM